MSKKHKRREEKPIETLNPAPVSAPAVPTKGRARLMVVAVVLFLAAFVPCAIYPNATSICFDELAAKDCGPMLQLLKNGDFRSPEWIQQGALVFQQYIYGMIPQILFGEDPSDPTQVRGARLIGAVLGTTITVMTFLLGIRLMPVPAAALAAVLLAFVPTVLGHNRIAMHDTPSRMLAVMSWIRLLDWSDQGRRRDLVWSAILAGLTVTFYIRVGMQNGLAIVLWLAWWFAMRRPFSLGPTFRTYLLFGIVSLASFAASTWGLWPYLWFRPLELIRIYSQYGDISGQVPGFWLGAIRPMPWYYYCMAVAVCTPPLTLLGFAGWHVMAVKRVWQDKAAVTLLLLFWVPLATISCQYRSVMAHYLQFSYVPLALMSAAFLWMVGDWLQTKWRARGRTMAWSLVSAVVVMELVACASVAPYFMEYFNVFAGGGANVSKKKLFPVETYGEAIQPLFDYLHRNGQAGASVLCRVGAWPGIYKMSHYLGPSFLLLGQQCVDPLGARYILRVSVEKDNIFYRYEPDPRFYECRMTVKAAGLELGEVWERKPAAALCGLVYSDDFASYQLGRFAVGATNMDINIFSDGKLFSRMPGQPAALAMRLPANVFGAATTLVAEADIQMQQGWFRILVGKDQASLRPVLTTRNRSGQVVSDAFIRPENEDLIVVMEWETMYRWNGKPGTFWNADWVDAFRIFAAEKR